MKNQFFYTRMDVVQPVINGKETFKPFKSSFNINKIVRSEELDNGHVIVLLDDLHQRWQNIEVKNKAGKVTGIKREVNAFQSEIYLTEPADIQAFYALTSVIETDYSAVIKNENTVIVDWYENRYSHISNKCILCTWYKVY